MAQKTAVENMIKYGNVSDPRLVTVKDAISNSIDNLRKAIKTLKHMLPAEGTVSILGWTVEEALETRSKLSSFETDWDRPDMDRYDDKN